MRNILLTILIGFIAGIIDILPMLKMKQDKNSVLSAFSVYFISAFLIFGSSLLGMAWWLKGAVITLLIALPVMFLIAKSEKKAIPVVTGMAVILGTIIGITGHFMNITL